MSSRRTPKPAVAAGEDGDDDEPEMEVWEGSLWEVMPEWAAFFGENREALAADGVTVPDEWLAPPAPKHEEEERKATDRALTASPGEVALDEDGA